MSETIWENFPRYAFLFLIFLLPLWFLPYTAFPLEINKSFLFYGITLLAAIFWLISILQKASFKIPKSAALLSFAAVVLVWLVSAFFSSNVQLSLIGAGYETGTFFSLLILGVAMFLVPIIFHSEKKVMTFYFVLFASSFLVFIFQLFRAGFDVTLFPWNVFTSKISNTIGSWNEVGIFFGLMGLLALVFVELFHFSKRLKIFFLVSLIISLIAVAFVNFTAIWVVLGVFLLVFLVYLFSVFLASKEEAGSRSRKFVNLAVLVLLVALFFIMAKALMGDFVSSLGMNSIEVRPAWSSTWQVVKNVLGESPILGSGPNTFMYDWLKFKPAEINATVFWSYPFSAGIGFLPSYLATGGILAGAAWFAFLVLLLFYGLKVISYSERETMRGLLIASFLGSLYLWTFFVIYTPSFFLSALTFMITGIFISLLVQSGRIKVIEISFLNKPKTGFVASLAVVLLMIAGVAGFYLLFQKYWAAYSFNRGLETFNSDRNVDEAENLVNRAVRFDPQDNYYRTLTDIGLYRIQQLMARTDISPDDLRTQFQNILAVSIGNAQNATAVNSLDFLNWMSLGRIYEAVVPIKIAGAREAAISAYEEASRRAPYDPRPLFYAARVEIQAGETKSGRLFLEKSIGIKGDYADALFLLSQIEAQEGNLKEAIKRTEQTLYLTPNDIGVLFQLGLLYYQDKNFENSRLALERAVNLSPNYSNARYFLGLVYDKQGKKQEAISQFERILELNPANQEVQKILANLKKNKPALDKIVPPETAPEKRSEPPIEETNTERQ